MTTPCWTPGCDYVAPPGTVLYIPVGAPACRPGWQDEGRCQECCDLIRQVSDRYLTCSVCDEDLLTPLTRLANRDRCADGEGHRCMVLDRGALATILGMDRAGLEAEVALARRDGREAGQP